MERGRYLPPSPLSPTRRRERTRGGGTGARGSVRECAGCGYVFVLRQRDPDDAECGRCGDPDVRKWRPATET